MSNTLRSHAQRLGRLLDGARKDQRGNVALTFGLAATPIIVLAGAALDYSRASSLHSALQSGTDAAALAMCQLPATKTEDELKTFAKANIQAFIGDRGTVTIDELKATSSPRSINVTTSSKSDTAFFRIMNKPVVDVKVSAACSAGEAYFEIALVLDTTGSMDLSSGSGQPTKMESAKTAAKDFVDYMFTTGALPGRVRMSLVPFAASVAVPTSLRTASWMDTQGLSPIHWQYVSGASGQSFTSRLSIYDQLKKTDTDWAWAGCVESPPYPHNVKDDAVGTGTPASLIVPMFAPDEVSSGVPTKDKNKTTYVQDYDNANSYIDDGSAFGSGTCRSDDPSTQKRFTQACKYNARVTPRTSSRPGPNWQCTSRPFSTLGTAQATLKSEITALQPGGQTNIHEGFMWGWRTISPTNVFASGSAAPVAYGTKNYNKVIVLMTDGENTWSANTDVIGKSQYSAYGYFRNADGTDATSTNSRFKPTRTNMSTAGHARAAIDELTAEACTNAKAKGVVIYTVGFSTKNDPIDAAGLKLLKDCASAPENYFEANDSTSLNASFDKIAKGIGQLRLTK